ncbi:MAG: type IV secretory system conjugative DNA transfer family protein [Tenericutes bacterium]|nr:type IV secretory system conjugative DNA transfer family protein [Mycoplasmatota bacterium]
MKFRAEPKDIMMFLAFCFFLLYMVAIGVLNATSLLNTGTFYGIVPFQAFSGEYIATTLTFFFLVLIGIFVAVSSYFFDREKGFGFKTSKKDKGYSRWAKDKEIKTARNIHEIDPKAYTAQYAGIPVINNGKKMWVDDGEMHNLVVGSTGAGKTSLVVFPQVHSLAKKGESIILTDPKGELYEQTAEMLKERGYNIIVLNFRSPQNGNAWNPMALPYKLYKEGNTDKAIELLDDLALNILYQEKSSGDPFWEKTAADYFTGLALGLFEDAKEEQVNLNSVNLMSSIGEERFGGPNNNFIKEYFNSKDPSKPAYINASGTVFTAEETKQGILATFKQKIKLFSSRENLSEMLSYSNFDMKDIGKKKTAVFLIVQDEKKTLHPLATIFIKQCYETLIDVAQESGGKLPYRTNFILDEFANMPPLKDVTTMVTAARSRLIRFTFIIQNYAQLAQVYGKENGDTIRGNCNILYLISNELAALEEISKMCGEVKSKEKEKTSSTPLVTVSDLQRLNYGEAIWLRLRMMPYKTKLTDHYKMSFGKKYEKAGYPIREKKEVQLFDLKQFVKDMKKNQMQQMLGDVGGGPEINPMPFGLPGLGGISGGASPFMSSNNETPRTFNVDDLVKRIDAKIAELEEEEKQEKAAQEKQEKLDKKEKKNDKKLYEDDTDDDKFFDDFFNDED